RDSSALLNVPSTTLPTLAGGVPAPGIPPQKVAGGMVADTVTLFVQVLPGRPPRPAPAAKERSALSMGMLVAALVASVGMKPAPVVMKRPMRVMSVRLLIFVVAAAAI